MNRADRKFFLIFLLTGALAFVFPARLGGFDKGMELWLALGAVAITARVYRDLRDQPWYWPTIAFLACAQIPLVMVVPMPFKWQKALAWPYFIAACFLNTACIKLIGRVSRWRATSGASPGTIGGA